MQPSEAGQTETLLEKLLGEASWLLSHAEALADFGSKEEADAELGRAASCEEQAASLLDAAGREREAVIHRVSAASCREQLGEYGRAVTLLRAALSAPLPDEYRRTVEQQLARCLAAVPREEPLALRQIARKPAVNLG
jgi:predicted negative regulator of RcsB-dependent stress response